MTYTQALEVKQVLLQIGGSIPANLVDPIYNYYKTYINANAAKPCTCSPRYWNEMLIELKNKVEETIKSYEATQETISTP